MVSDIEIARAARRAPIGEVAARLGIPADALIAYGAHKAKIAATFLAALKDREDGTLIRANQGHSVNVDLGHVTSEPPPVLYHGTVAKFLGVIRAEGLRKGQRHHVHLSATLETAVRVGQRRGRALVLEVAAQAMARDGHRFFVSPNGVWLVEHVPPSYLAFPPEE